MIFFTAKHGNNPSSITKLNYSSRKLRLASTKKSCFHLVCYEEYSTTYSLKDVSVTCNKEAFAGAGLFALEP